MVPEMWINALTKVIRMSKKDFAKLDVISKWLILSRGATLMITILPTIIIGMNEYNTFASSDSKLIHRFAHLQKGIVSI